MPRPRFQFTLRTLLIGVTLFAILCACVGRQYQIVEERRRLIEDYQYHVRAKQDGRAKIPYFRKWLGDEQYGLIGLDNEAPDEVLEFYRQRFPEAVVARECDLL